MERCVRWVFSVPILLRRNLLSRRPRIEPVRPILLLLLMGFSLALAIGVVLGGRGGAADVTAVDWSSNCTPGSISGARAPRTTSPHRLLAIWWGDSATAKGTLAEVDPRTLALERRTRPMPFALSTWAFSPEGRQLALGGPEGAVRFVDLARMRTLGDLRPKGSGYVVALAWPSRNRLLAIEQWVGDVTHQRIWLLVIDPLQRRLLERRPVEGALDGIAEGNGRIVAVVAPPAAIGPARLVVVEPTGRVRCVLLRKISTGSEYVRTENVARVRTPGLALDPAADRAFVVSAEDPIAEVDLRDLRVSYHSLQAPASLLSRLRDWLEPEALADGLPMVGSRRQALWLGNGLLAISGSEQELGADGRYLESPAGLQLLDTTTWSVRSVDDRTSRIRLADSALLAFGGYGSERVGVSAYGLDGRLRFRLFEGRDVSDVRTFGLYAYVSIRDKVAVVDLRSGDVIRDSVPSLGELLAGEERPRF
jgi:hypothetical protein